MAKFVQNNLLKTDSYKLGGHWNMIPDDVTRTWSYCEDRQGSEFSHTLFFGLQAIIDEHLTGEVVIQKDLDEILEIGGYHFGTTAGINKKGWQTLIDEYKGVLPLQINAVPEGTLVPTGNILFSIVDTDPHGRFQWLGQYFEGLLMKTWMTSAVATRAYYIVKAITPFLEQTSMTPEITKQFVLHDFGYRSATTEEHAYMAGGAVLIATKGTDTTQAIKWLHDKYGAKYDEIAFSVPASEHRISMHYGKQGEEDYLEMMIDKHPTGIVSIVSDTYNIENFILNIVPKYKDRIIQRWQTGNGHIDRVVFRPDSPRFPGDTPANQVLWLIESLAATFGTSINAKGYMQLHPSVGVIYGDGLSVAEIVDIYETLALNNWDVSSVVVGQGGGLIQKGLNRDTLRQAIKPASEMVKGNWEALVKDPLDQTKKSKFGRLKLVNMTDNNGVIGLQTINEFHPLYNDCHDILRPKLINGELKNFETLAEIRKRVWE